MKKNRISLIVIICILVMMLAGCAKEPSGELSYQEVYNNYIEEQTEETWYAFVKVTGAKEPLLFIAEQCEPVYDSYGLRDFKAYEAVVYLRDGNEVKKIHEFRFTEESGYIGFLSVEQNGCLVEKRDDRKILIWEADVEKWSLVLKEEYNENATNSELQTGLDRYGEATGIKFSYFKPGQEL